MAPAARLTLDEGRTVKEIECGQCLSSFRRITNFVLREGTAWAVAFTELHGHDDVEEAWFDVILGTFEDHTSTDHVTFSCRVGPIEGSDEPAATAVDSTPHGDAPIYGARLRRDEALAHPGVDDFWDVVDFLLVADPDIHAYVYGHSPWLGPEPEEPRYTN